MAIVTRSEENEPFIILIETRFSSAQSKTIESSTNIKRKYDLINQNYGNILGERGIQWVFVYAAYRNLSGKCYSKAVPEDVLVLDVDRLLQAYGASYYTPALK